MARESLQEAGSGCEGRLSDGDRKLSLAFAAPHWPAASATNGISSYVGAMVPACRALGQDVTVISSQVPDAALDGTVYDIDRVRPKGTLADRLSARFWSVARPAEASERRIRRRLVGTVRRVLRERRVDVLEMEESWGRVEHVRLCGPLAVCIRVHGPWCLAGPASGAADDERYRLRVRAEGIALERAHGITVPSSIVLERLRTFYGLDLEHAAVVPNPVAIPAPEARWDLASCDRGRILFVGRSDRLKGIDLLLAAFRRIRTERSDTGLTLIGPDDGYVGEDGVARRAPDLIESALPGALASGSVEWLGSKPRGELDAFRRRAMVCVVPSRYETFPYTVAEAFAVGCPVVASDVGGIPELLRDGENGLLHKSGDPEHLAARILELLRSPARAAKLGARARADAAAQLSAHAVAQQLLDVYRAAVGRHRRGTGVAS